MTNSNRLIKLSSISRTKHTNISLSSATLPGELLTLKLWSEPPLDLLRCAVSVSMQNYRMAQLSPLYTAGSKQCPQPEVDTQPPVETVL